MAGNSLDGGSTDGILDVRFDVAPGDINGDGQVFTTDLLSWQAAFNSLPGSENYNSAADLNGDGQIFTTDLLTWQAYFNRDLVNRSEPAESSFLSTAPEAATALSQTLRAAAIDEIFSDEEDLDLGRIEHRGVRTRF